MSKLWSPRWFVVSLGATVVLSGMILLASYFTVPEYRSGDGLTSCPRFMLNEGSSQLRIPALSCPIVEPGFSRPLPVYKVTISDPDTPVLNVPILALMSGAIFLVTYSGLVGYGARRQAQEGMERR